MSSHPAPLTTVVPPRKRNKTRKAKSKDAQASAGRGGGAAAAEDAEPEVVLKFRNYAPSDAPVPDETAKPQASAAKQAEEAIEEELQRSLVTSKDEAVRITPQSANWDLKRDVAERLKKLERQTLRSIRSLVQDRIAAEKQSGEGNDNDDSSSSSSGSSGSSGSDSDGSGSSSSSDSDGDD
jgi:hypothetical protein